MMETRFSSSLTELWYPYGGPGKAYVNQALEDFEDYFTNNPNHPRPDQALTGS